MRKPVACGKVRSWLTGTDSLTQRLQSSFDDFSVCTTTLIRTLPWAEETACLQQPRRWPVMMREVYLYGGGQPRVFAHSLLPSKHCRGHWLKLNRLGNKPLGAILFGNPCASRTALTFRKLPRQHPLYRRSLAHAGYAYTKPVLWARRSVFYLGHAKILVTEVFLPEVLAT